jgi:zinc transporter ZupT
MQKKYTEFFFGALAFFIIDRLVRMLGTRSVNGHDKEFNRCKNELIVTALIGITVIFIHLKD